jgi:hypothetical protein
MSIGTHQRVIKDVITRKIPATGEEGKHIRGRQIVSTGVLAALVLMRYVADGGNSQP